MGNRSGQVLVCNFGFEQYILGASFDKFALQIFVGTGTGENDDSGMVMWMLHQKVQHFHAVYVGQAVIKQHGIKVVTVK
jgi:hypothetical protein